MVTMSVMTEQTKVTITETGAMRYNKTLVAFVNWPLNTKAYLDGWHSLAQNWEGSWAPVCFYRQSACPLCLSIFSVLFLMTLWFLFHGWDLLWVPPPLTFSRCVCSYPHWCPTNLVANPLRHSGFSEDFSHIFASLLRPSLASNSCHHATHPRLYRVRTLTLSGSVVSPLFKQIKTLFWKWKRWALDGLWQPERKPEATCFDDKMPVSQAAS